MPPLAALLQPAAVSPAAARHGPRTTTTTAAMAKSYSSFHRVVGGSSSSRHCPNNRVSGAGGYARAAVVAKAAPMTHSPLLLRRFTQRHELAAARSFPPGAVASSHQSPFLGNPPSPGSRGRANEHRGRGRWGGPVRTVALVNIDLGPSTVLGASLMVSAIGLYQARPPPSSTFH